jgi:hypothetical protein
MSEILNEVTRKHFDFLISDYGFKYHGFTDWGETLYVFEKLIIECTVDRIIPIMVFKRSDEPDDYQVELGIVLEAFEIIPWEIFKQNLRKNSLEDNGKYIEKMFREISEILIKQPEFWWLNAQKKKFEIEENLNHEYGQDPTRSESYRRWYHYIKSNDPNWEAKYFIPKD